MRGLNTTLSEHDFEMTVDGLAESIYNYGLLNLVRDINAKHNPIRDWKRLKNKDIKATHINSTATTGLVIIKKHMLNIYEVENYKRKSLSNQWTIPHIKKALIINRKTHTTPYASEIIRQISFIAGKSMVTIYRPLLTKTIVQYFKAKKVLDPCIGWGGRMLGSLCLDGVKYVGIEPNTVTFSNLNKILNELGIDSRRYTLYHDKAENKLQSIDEKFDLILTSPPYFNLEFYCDEKTQSHMYGTYELWLENFLEPVIKQCLDKLDSNGVSCWSIKNFKTDKKYKLLDDVIAIHTKYGFEINDNLQFYVGNPVRPGSKHKRGKEITYVFERRM
jgi:hypothetical protein